MAVKEYKIRLAFYLLSLWFIVIAMLGFTVQIPIYFGKDWEFVGVCQLLKINCLPLTILILYCLCFYASKWYLNQVFEGTRNFSVTVKKVENISGEYLVYLATYIIPLVCFDFNSVRHLLILLFLLVVIGIIHNRVNLFYANPTLSFLKYNVYKVDVDNGDIKLNDAIVIIKSDLNINDSFRYIDLGGNILYAQKQPAQKQLKIKTDDKRKPIRKAAYLPR